MRNPIIAALDVPTAEEALKLAEQLVPVSGGFKVGSELFTSAGPEIVRRIRALGAPVFLDLKFHDIPNTVAKAVAATVRLDVQMLSVHISGGREMIKAAEQTAQESAWRLGHTPPLVLGVTVLTSLDSNALSELGFDPNAARQVRRLANMANKVGLPPDDQKRTLTPKEALQAGASWLVIGRPIYAAENPRAAAERILTSLG